VSGQSIGPIQAALPLMKASIRDYEPSSAAVACSPPVPSAASPSSTNTAVVVVAVIRVWAHWRQFHRRQVTPRSSRQITSPGSARPARMRAGPVHV